MNSQNVSFDCLLLLNLLFISNLNLFAFVILQVNLNLKGNKPLTKNWKTNMSKSFKNYNILKSFLKL